jgi:hypothetical protein
VSEDERPGERHIADPAFRVPVAVGAAQADRGHAEQHLALGGLRLRLLVEADVARAVDPENLHRCP